MKRRNEFAKTALASNGEHCELLFWELAAVSSTLLAKIPYLSE